MHIETVLGLVLTIGISLTLGTGSWKQFYNPVAADNEDDLKKYKDLEDLYDAIDDYEFDDDNIDWKDFKNSQIFENSTKQTQKCMEKAEHLGDNLADYELYDCYGEEEEEEKD
jgi:hypothetical protein